MPADTLVANPHLCSACRLVISRGHRSGICAFLGVSEGTLERMVAADTASRWTEARIDALQKYEETVLKTDTIRHARLDALTGSAPVGDPYAVERDVSADIGMKAEHIGKQNLMLADGRIDVREAKIRVADIDIEIAALRKERADLLARIAQESRP